MAWKSGLVERLKKGETVQFRPHGNSMTPIVKSGQLVTGLRMRVGNALFRLALKVSPDSGATLYQKGSLSADFVCELLGLDPAAVRRSA